MPFTFVYRTSYIYMSALYISCRYLRCISCSVLKYEWHSSLLTGLSRNALDKITIATDPIRSLPRILNHYKKAFSAYVKRTKSKSCIYYIASWSIKITLCNCLIKKNLLSNKPPTAIKKRQFSMLWKTFLWDGIYVWDFWWYLRYH